MATSLQDTFAPAAGGFEGWGSALIPTLHASHPHPQHQPALLHAHDNIPHFLSSTPEGPAWKAFHWQVSNPSTSCPLQSGAPKASSEYHQAIKDLAHTHNSVLTPSTRSNGTKAAMHGACCTPPQIASGRDSSTDCRGAVRLRRTRMTSNTTDSMYGQMYH